MKKKTFAILMLVSFLSCKNDSKSEQKEATPNHDSEERTSKQSDGLTLLQGEFVYYDGAAVLQTNSDIYGVLVTNKMLELNEIAQKHKSDPTDMVKVEIRGKVTNQKDDKILWENKVEVIEILNVTPIKQQENNIVKLGEE